MVLTFQAGGSSILFGSGHLKHLDRELHDTGVQIIQVQLRLMNFRTEQSILRKKGKVLVYKKLRANEYLAAKGTYQMMPQEFENNGCLGMTLHFDPLVEQHTLLFMLTPPR